MTKKIGIRHEDKYTMERRAPLTPMHVKNLIAGSNLTFEVQTSTRRAFSNDEYSAAGATIVNNLSGSDIILGVKEIPINAIQENKTYLIFSHVIKGQLYNMPMLQRMMELKCNLIDYERIVDENNRRLIFFGRFAGLAGMINSLWSLGRRLEEMGYRENAFSGINQAYTYSSLEEAKKDIIAAGQIIESQGLPTQLLPLTVGFTGYGNVSKGAQEIIDLLPTREISPAELLSLKQTGKYEPNCLYKVVFHEHHISRSKDPLADFDLPHYYKHPEKYENNFEQYIPHLTLLMNCMYWDSRYPRLFTRDFAWQLYSLGEPKIKVVGDVTCDPEGSIEFTHKGTQIDDPVFVYNPFTKKPTMGFKGEGILVMAVDILPSELSVDASQAFGDALQEFIEPISKADFNDHFTQLKLPHPIKRALILHRGRLTPEYDYIEQYLSEKVENK